VDFKTGAELQFNPTIETDILQGDGRSYGVEFSLAKSTGWLTGWLNYTYSRSYIRLDGSQPSEIINGGAFFPTGYDRPHYLNSVTNYKFTRRITMTLNLVYSSGVPFFLGLINIYGYRNASGPILLLLVTATAIYFLGVVLVTIFGNVPLNEIIEKTNLWGTSSNDLKTIRNIFEVKWNRLHMLRTLSAITSFLVLIISLMQVARNTI
jgi:hypothetical protein